MSGNASTHAMKMGAIEDEKAEEEMEQVKKTLETVSVDLLEVENR